MTNEELALQIKNGKEEFIDELWLQIESFVKQQAYKFASSNTWSERCRALGFTYEDLYCAGYFALEPAIKAFDPKKGAFLTIFTLYLKRAFYKEIGVNQSGGKWYTKRDMLSEAASLEETVYENKDGDSTTLEAFIEDPTAQDAFEAIQNEEYRKSLHADLEEAINALRPRDAQLIRDHYYNLLSVDEQAKKYNLSRSRVDQIRFKALQLLKKHAALQSYKERFYGSTSYTSYRSWKERGMSQQEIIAIKIDEYERRLGLK